MSIPWESYVQYTSSQPVPGARPPPTPRNPLARLDSLAESRRMMADPGMLGGSGNVGETGMSFAMLCQLISEGRAGEVGGLREIPDQLNVSSPRFSRSTRINLARKEAPSSQAILPSRPKPWEQSPRTTSSGQLYQTIPYPSQPAQQYQNPFSNPSISGQASGFTYNPQGSMAPPPPPHSHASSSSPQTQRSGSSTSLPATEWEDQTPGSSRSY